LKKIVHFRLERVELCQKLGVFRSKIRVLLRNVCRQTLHLCECAHQSFANLDLVPVLPDVQFAETLHFLPKLPVRLRLHSVCVDLQLHVPSFLASSVPNDKRLVRVFDPIRASRYATERVHFFIRDDKKEAAAAFAPAARLLRRREEADRHHQQQQRHYKTIQNQGIRHHHSSFSLVALVFSFL
jgi:hypothetical protein